MIRSSLLVFFCASMLLSGCVTTVSGKGKLARDLESGTPQRVVSVWNEPYSLAVEYVGV